MLDHRAVIKHSAAWFCTMLPDRPIFAQLRHGPLARSRERAHYEKLFPRLIAAGEGNGKREGSIRRQSPELSQGIPISVAWNQETTGRALSVNLRWQPDVFSLEMVTERTSV